MAPERVGALPHVPTVVEAGFPDRIIQDWTGLVIKRGTPDEIVTRFNVAVNKALATPKVRDAIVKLAAELGGGSPGDFGQLISSHIAYWEGGQGIRNEDRMSGPGDFKITLLGTGVPIPSIERFGPSTLIEAGDQKLLIDAGRARPSGSTRSGSDLSRRIVLRPR